MPKGVWSDHTWPVSPVCLDCSEPAAWVPLGALFAAQVPNNDIAIVIASRPRGSLTTSSALISQFQCWPSPICCLLLCIAVSQNQTWLLPTSIAIQLCQPTKGPKKLPGAFLGLHSNCSAGHFLDRGRQCVREASLDKTMTRETHTSR